jgi:hypothetical protein
MPPSHHARTALQDGSAHELLLEFLLLSFVLVSAALLAPMRDQLLLAKHLRPIPLGAASVVAFSSTKPCALPPVSVWSTLSLGRLEHSDNQLRLLEVSVVGGDCAISCLLPTFRYLLGVLDSTLLHLDDLFNLWPCVKLTLIQGHKYRN